MKSDRRHPRARKRGPMPLPRLILTDLLLLGIALIVFALFHHVLPHALVSEGLKVSRPGAATPQPADDAAPAATVSPAASSDPEPTLAAGDFSHIKTELFTEEDVLEEDTENGMTYISPNVNVTVEHREADYGNGTIRYTLMDIYIRDITCLRSVFANGTYEKGGRASTPRIAASAGALCAINGDYYGNRHQGIVLRNGELYRSEPFEDICVLYWDGTMKTYQKGCYDLDAILRQNPYQIWSFGPELLTEDGAVKEYFNSDVKAANPRTVIGFYEPGHYCFVAVDGRQKQTEGATMSELSRLMNELGCKQAYNLDGGQTTEMVWKGEMINSPAGGGRSCSDIICIVDAPAEQSDTSEVEDPSPSEKTDPAVSEHDTPAPSPDCSAPTVRPSATEAPEAPEAEKEVAPA